MLWNERVTDTVSFEAWAKTKNGGRASRVFDSYMEAAAWLNQRRQYIVESGVRPLKSQVRAYDSMVGAWAQGQARPLDDGDGPDVV